VLDDHLFAQAMHMEVAGLQLHWLLEARCADAGAHTHISGVVGSAWAAAEAKQLLERAPQRQMLLAWLSTTYVNHTHAKQPHNGGRTAALECSHGLPGELDCRESNLPGSATMPFEHVTVAELF
jgi:hypothetical protein